MLYYSTVSPLLKASLKTLMASEIMKPFRLVGGTSLSLQLGHRTSIDIDLFTDAKYDSLDFKEIENFLQQQFLYVRISSEISAMGKCYFIGENINNSVKLDVFYTDPFLYKELVVDGIRLASLEEIIAMKLEVIQNGGRKKDFWDLHELLADFSINDMLQLHKNRYPYSHERNLIIENFTNFEFADEDLDVLCLRGKHWEIIKSDFENEMNKFKNNG